MAEIIKFLPPMAFIGLLWAIYQFYQKRADIKKGKIRDEKVKVYTSIHSVIREIEFKILKFISNSRIPVKNTIESLILVNKSLQNFSSDMAIFETEITQLEENNYSDKKAVRKVRNNLQENKFELEKINNLSIDISKGAILDLDELFQELTSTLELNIEELNKIPILLIKLRVIWKMLFLN